MATATYEKTQIRETRSAILLAEICNRNNWDLEVSIYGNQSPKEAYGISVQRKGKELATFNVSTRDDGLFQIVGFEKELHENRHSQVHIGEIAAVERLCAAAEGFAFNQSFSENRFRKEASITRYVVENELEAKLKLLTDVFGKIVDSREKYLNQLKQI